MGQEEKKHRRKTNDREDRKILGLRKELYLEHLTGRKDLRIVSILGKIRRREAMVSGGGGGNECRSR